MEVKPPYFQKFVHHFVNADSSTTLREKELYKQEIQAILNSGINRWSLTRFSYFLSIIIESFFLARGIFSLKIDIRISRVFSSIVIYSVLNDLIGFAIAALIDS